MPKSHAYFHHNEVHAYQFGYHPYSQPKVQVYLYYVDGLLIDTGQSHMQKDIFANLKNLPVSQMCITHHHEDHTGNLALLKNYFGCPAFSSDSCIELMKDPPPISFSQKLVWGNRPAFHGLQALDSALETPQYKFDIIPIPGHAEDMIALHEPHEGWLFSADMYVHHYIAYFMRQESMKQQIASIKRVLSLDFDVLFCCHNPQLEAPREKLHKKLQFLESFYGKVAEEYHRGNSPKHILRNLDLKEKWPVRLLSHGHLSRINMIKSVIRDENSQNPQP